MSSKRLNKKERAYKAYVIDFFMKATKMMRKKKHSLRPSEGVFFLIEAGAERTRKFIN